jgi:hypothetical protein
MRNSKRAPFNEMSKDTPDVTSDDTLDDMRTWRSRKSERAVAS